MPLWWLWMPWVGSFWHKRAGIATSWSQPMRAQYLYGSRPMRGLHSASSRNRRVTAPGLRLRSSSTGLRAAAPGHPVTPLSVDWKYTFLGLYNNWSFYLNTSANTGVGVALPLLSVTSLTSSTTYVAWKYFRCENILGLTIEIFHRGPGLDCRTLSTRSQFLHHNCGNRQSCISSSLPRNRPLGLDLLGFRFTIKHVVQNAIISQIHDMFVRHLISTYICCCCRSWT